MKKILIADVMKDIVDSYLEERALRIKELLDQFNITEDDATKIVDNYSNEDTQYLIAKAMEDYDLGLGEAEMFVDDHPNESEWADLEAAAEALGVDITDVEDDDVENLMDLWDLAGSQGNKPYSTIESSIGKVHPWYDQVLKSLMLLIVFNDGNPANYPISRDDLAEIVGSGSFGKYYSENMRSNDSYSDLPGSWGCIGSNPDSPKRLMTAEDKAKLPLDLQELV
jgi:hypothetical protein